MVRHLVNVNEAGDNDKLG